MISWLKGRVLHIDPPEIVLDCNGIGYQVRIGPNVMQSLAIKEDTELEISVYTAVREDAIQLFGFESFLVRKVFLHLLTVNGIGPKQALNIIDHLSVEQIHASVSMGDAGTLITVPGIGKKTAQRIILDLQGKLDQLPISSESLEHSAAENRGTAFGTIGNIRIDAKSALQNLGFSDKEADRAIARHWKDEISFPELIRFCLSDLQRH